MQDRKSTKSVEQAVKEAEQIVIQANTLDELEDSLAKAAEGMQFYKASIKFFHSDKRLGSPLDEKNNRQIGKTIHWRDMEQSGYFSRDKEFSVEFAISGRNFAYGKAEYVFMDGRSSLSVQDEVLLERYT